MAYVRHTEGASEGNTIGICAMLGGARTVRFYQVVDDDGDEYAVFVTDQGEVISALVCGPPSAPYLEFCPTTDSAQPTRRTMYP